MRITIHKKIELTSDCMLLDISLFCKTIQDEIKKIVGTIDSNVSVYNNGFYTFIYCGDKDNTRIDIDNSSL